MSPRRTGAGLLLGVVLVGGALAASRQDLGPGGSSGPGSAVSSGPAEPAVAPSDPASRSVTGSPRTSEPALPSTPSTPTATLPPAQARRFPAPGFEEQVAPLAVAPPVPQGETRFAFSGTQPEPGGAPIAWSPCRPIHYVVDPTGAPAGFSEQVRAAMAELSAATGLVLVDDGAFDEASDIRRPAFSPALYGDRWAPVLVGFADEASVPVLAGGTTGITSAIPARDPGTGTRHWVTGVVYLDTELLGQQGRSGGPAYAPVLRHELGHVIGLGHVDDLSQLLHPLSTVETYQPGDLAGLAALGRGPCAPGL